MQFRTLGSTDMDASVIGLGTWAIGGWMWGGTDRQEAIDAIRASLDAGVNLVDTAPIYGFGVSEEIVGEAIQGRRDEVILATKCGMIWHDEKGDFAFNTDEKMAGRGEGKVYKHLGRDSIRYEIEQSLRRLKVDHVDLYQTHWQESTTPVEETMETLLKLKEEGKIRAIGVSNCPLQTLKAYQAVGTVDSAQEKYNMLDRDLEEELIPHYRQTGVSLLSYSSIARGLLSGKMSPDREFEDGDAREGAARFSPENRKKANAMLSEFQPIAETHGISLAQLVVAWTVAQPGVTYALVGARDRQQASENAAAGDVVLSDNELDVMRSVLEEHAPTIV
jgi:aryl-alcohol dehydrogenase-like predicted oxidoreductase